MTAPPFALVDREANQKHLFAHGQLFKHRATGRAAGVVHQYTRQARREQGIDHRTAVSWL